MFDWVLKYAFKQGSFISDMERTPFKCLFSEANDSVVKVMVSITSGVSL